MTFSRTDSNFSAKSQETRSPFIFVNQQPSEERKRPWRATRKDGDVQSQPEGSGPHAQDSELWERPCEEETLPWVHTHTRDGHAHTRDGHTHSLTCCAALSASSANSTDRPFSACFRDPHVLLCRVAQEGSGVVSDPKALRTMERPTQGLEDDQQPK